ncbi:LysE family translocator [Micromonospora chokoriensis]
MAALGVATGEAVHIAAVVCGLATVIAASPVLFTVIRWVGAAYLIVLGVRALRGAFRKAGAGWQFRAGLPAWAGDQSPHPKMILFSVAFLPQFVDPAQGNASRSGYASRSARREGGPVGRRRASCSAVSSGSDV